MEDPIDLLARHKLGREEYCQRLLTMLILEAPYPKWNTRSQPSPRGRQFLEALDAMSFGEPGIDDSSVFIDEFDLPARSEAERGSAPDYAVLSATRLWIIELKTEVSSHRPAQLPAYLELGRHHHPHRQLDLTYLTPSFSFRGPALGEQMRFAHVTWQQVLPLVASIWGDRRGLSGSIAATLEEAVGTLGTSWPRWREEQLAQAKLSGVQARSYEQIVATVFDLAEQTSRDGVQRALEDGPENLDDLKDLRVDLRDRLSDSADDRVRRVRPWVWRAQSSGGEPLTRQGASTGYELRLSLYRAPA